MSLLPAPLLLLGLFCAGAAAPLAAAPVDPSLLAGLKARSIGPAVVSGRVADVAGVESNPDILYIGAANGGIWKSVNGGLTWDPIFDDQKVASIGALAVFQANPDIVWAGTGEGNPRNSVSVGWGVYRSLDGGRTWKHLGLEKTEHIYRIVLHPTDPDVAWVSALGKLWGENSERGVFKTTDGGRTWRKVLYIDERTGASDLVIDPANPNKLFASTWEHRRWPWFFRSGGPGSGIHVTYDGGETWKRLTEDDGLPSGDLGRIGLAISRSNPEIVYALVEAGKSALVRSDDGGRTWKTVNDDPRTANRPFYYSDIRVDPVWPSRVYNIATRLSVSNDGGRTFEEIDTKTHGDFHAMWIDPNDPESLVTGSDGGLGITRDRGRTWYFPPNLPLAQYYHVNVDMDVPYNVYGGLQDNGSWRGPSEVQDDNGIRNLAWTRVGGGDGFDVAPDPQDSQIGYSMSQGGELMRWNLRTGEQKSVQPPGTKAGDSHEPLRFNWNSGLAIDPFEPGTIYYGSQYVHKSTDRGDTWTIISPDLTTDNPEWQKQSESGGLTPDVSGAENFTTILAIAPSPVQRGVLWVGTDDGRLHVTRDGGKSWTSVEKSLPGVPANTWIPHIRASHFDAASAFVVLDNHRRSDWETYVFRTDDWGKTWKSLAAKDVDGYALSIEQDPVDRNLLFLGTEFGLWVSTDGGQRWMRWTHGLPTTAVADLVVHPREHDLVIATHGRGLYIIDDISSLRGLKPETLREPLHLFPATPGRLDRREISIGNNRAGAGDYRGENRPYGIQLTWSLNLPGLPLQDEEAERTRKDEERSARTAEAKGPAKPGETLKEDPETAEPAGDTAKKDSKDTGPRVDIRIEDASGKLIRKMDGPARLGVNRATWDLGRDLFPAPPPARQGGRRPTSGPKVPPGTYKVTVKYKDHTSQQTVQVVPSPLTKNTPEDWQAREAAFERARGLQESLVAALDRITAARADIDVVQKKLDAADKARKAKDPENTEDPNRELRKAAKALKAKLDATERKIAFPGGGKGLLDESGTAFDQVQTVRRSIESSWDRPNATQLSDFDRAEATTRAALAEVDRVWAEDIAAFRKQVEAAGIGLFPPPTP